MPLQTWFTRDGALLWCFALAALLAYLAASPPPSQWTYYDWIKFGTAAVAWGIGKLQTSSLPSKAEVASLGSVPPRQ